MKKIILAVLLLGVLAAVAFYLYTKEQASPCQVVLKYEDFGPTIMSSKLLGQPFWQWYSTIEDRDAKFDIKVVVYTQSEDIDKIKNQFPVIEDNNQDYRYVVFTKVKQYLKRVETEDKDFFKGCRADACPELEFFDSLHNKLKPLNVSRCN